MINETSELTRQVHFLFLLVGVYLAILLGSTTHKQLLLQSDVTLPLLNVGLPIIKVYIAVPVLWLLLHFNMLLLLDMFAHKVQGWWGLLDRVSPEERRTLFDSLHAFPFTQWVAAVPSNRGMFSLYVWTTSVILPLGLLILAQVRFLPYHSEAITWEHRGLIFLDLLILWYFWRRIRRVYWVCRERMGGGASSRPWADRAHHLWPGVVSGLVTVLTLGFSLALATFPDEGMEEAIGWQDALRDSRNLLTRSLSVPNEILVKDPPSPEIIAAYIQQGAGKGLAPETATEQAWVDHAMGLDFRGRDLSYANFSGSRLYSAVFGKIPESDNGLAVLNGALFNSAKLHKTNFVKLRNARNVHFRRAELPGADLFMAELPDADLLQAKLPGANLSMAVIPGADLSGADLSGADLSSADLPGADLRGAILFGTDLKGARLPGAGLTGARLSGANLKEAKLFGANFLNARLNAINLQKSQMAGAMIGGYAFSLAMSNLDIAIPSCPEKFQMEIWNSMIKKIPDQGKRTRLIESMDELKGNGTEGLIIRVIDPPPEMQGASWSLKTESFFPGFLGQYTSTDETSRMRAVGDAYLCNDFFVSLGVMRQFGLFKINGPEARAFLEKKLTNPDPCPNPTPPEGTPASLVKEYQIRMDRLLAAAKEVSPAPQ